MTPRCCVRRDLPLFLWAGALAYLSLVPEVKVPGGIQPWDKFSHFAAYAVLAVLLARALACRRKLSIRLLTLVLLACCGYGLLLEGLQWAMAVGRMFETGDLLANGLGALGGCAVFCRRPGRESSS